MKKYYAGYCSYGVNFSYSSGCWEPLVFTDKASRDAWVKAHEYSQVKGYYVAEAITRKQALICSGGGKDIIIEDLLNIRSEMLKEVEARKAKGYKGLLGRLVSINGDEMLERLRVDSI